MGGQETDVTKNGTGKGLEPGGTPRPEKVWSRNLVLAMLVNGVVLAAFLGQSSTVPIFAHGFGANDIQVGLNAMVATLAALALRPVVGWMLDGHGRVPVLVIGIVLLAAASAATAFVPGLFLLYVCSALRGAAFSFTSTACITLATDAIPHSRLSEGIGHYGIAAILAGAVGPTLGLSIVQTFGFPALWLGSGALVALLLVLAFLVRSQHDDALAIRKKDEQACAEWLASEHAPQKLVLQAPVVVPVLMNLLGFLAFGSLMTFLPLWIVDRQIVNGGLFFAVQSGATLLVRIFGNRLGERFGYRRMMLTALPVMTFAYFLIGFGGTLPSLLAAAVLYGLANGVVQPLVSAALMKATPIPQRGKANALYMAASDVGLSVGSILMGTVSTLVGLGLVFYVSSAFVAVQFLLVGLTKAIPGKARKREASL